MTAAAPPPPTTTTAPATAAISIIGGLARTGASPSSPSGAGAASLLGLGLEDMEAIRAGPAWGAGAVWRAGSGRAG